MRVTRSYLNHDGSSRVDILQRADGTFGFEQFNYLAEENAWVPQWRQMISVLDSEETAIREAKSRIAWLDGGSVV